MAVPRMRRDLKVRILLFAILLTASGCGESKPAPDLPLIRGFPTGSLEISRAGNEVLSLRVEVASTPKQRVTGLMNIKDMPEDAGMAFQFETSTQGSFFMKNTLMPLDITFWDEQGIIVDILQMEPCTKEPCPLFTPKTPYIGAVETKRGTLSRADVRLGDSVSLSLVP